MGLKNGRLAGKSLLWPAGVLSVTAMKFRIKEGTSVMGFMGRAEDWMMVIVIACLYIIVPLLLIRWVVQTVKSSVKARQDLVRGVADIAERLARIESKLGETQSPKQ
jgi:hypothetical protein